MIIVSAGKLLVTSNCKPHWQSGEIIVLKLSINQTAAKPLPGAKEYTYKSNKVSRLLLDFSNHLWVLLRILYIIPFYGFIQTELGKSLIAYNLWVKIPLWILLFIWVIRSIRKRNITILFTSLIIWGVPLLWVYGVISIYFFDVELLET